MKQTVCCNMKFLWICICSMAMTVAWLGFTAGLTTPANSTRKLQVGENFNPQVYTGKVFDEIVVESNLNIRGKSPGARSGRTQLFPIKSNGTKAPNESVTLTV